MVQIILDSHDLLGKLSIIKNALFVALEKPEKEEYLKTAIQANQELIDSVERAAENGEDSDR